MSEFDELEEVLAQHRAGKFSLSVVEYRRLLEGNSQSHLLWHLLGIGLAQLGKFGEAEAALRNAVAIFSSDPSIYVHLANAQWGQRKLQSALENFRVALSLDPTSVEAHRNCGKVLNESDSPEAAIEHFEAALKVEPGDNDVLNSLASALVALGRDGEALHVYDQILQSGMPLPEAKWNKSLVLLRRGDFRSGWPLHTESATFHCPKTLIRFPRNPPWGGSSPIRGKTILLHSDQGLGDVIQYCRYVNTLHELGASVILELPKALKALLTCLRGYTRIFTRGEALPSFDLHCPFSNLPAALRTDLETIPREHPYLMPNEEKKREWARRLGERDGRLRVGLAWAGNPQHLQDRNRSIALGAFENLRSSRVEVVSVLPEAHGSLPRDVARVCDRSFFGRIEDFADTAAIIANLDLVVTVDTSVAHLAGALGAPVWILLPFVADWRWLHNRSDSPWYPRARLFRQTTRGDWRAPISEITAQILKLVTEQSV